MARSVTEVPHRTDRYAPVEQTVSSENVGMAERWISAIGGGALLVYGVARFDWLGAGLGVLGGGLLYRGVTGHSFAYQGFNINTAQRRRGETVTELSDQKGFRVQRSLTINRTPEELYEIWYDVKKTPLYMQNIESVTKTGERSSHWVAQNSSGKSIEWDREILEDAPGKGIKWRTRGNPMTANAGNVQFEAAPDGRGSIVTLILDYYTPEGPFWNNLGKRFGIVDDHETLETLRCFK
ncbi:MAG: DUF2892 domain-containing protein, partial [Ktedonobacteraceae bacterium]|nr:DUF2892 domain-containing protein [Ktedonobacteraceae bacterium]